MKIAVCCNPSHHHCLIRATSQSHLRRGKRSSKNASTLPPNEMQCASLCTRTTVTPKFGHLIHRSPCLHLDPTPLPKLCHTYVLPSYMLNPDFPIIQSNHCPKLFNAPKLHFPFSPFLSIYHSPTKAHPQERVLGPRPLIYNLSHTAYPLPFAANSHPSGLATVRSSDFCSPNRTSTFPSIFARQHPFSARSITTCTNAQMQSKVNRKWRCNNNGCLEIRLDSLSILDILMLSQPLRPACISIIILLFHLRGIPREEFRTNLE